MNDIIYRLDSDEPWTQRQIDIFMEQMKVETFEAQDAHRGESGGRIVELVREDEDGERTRYVKEDGEWSAEE